MRICIRLAAVLALASCAKPEPVAPAAPDPSAPGRPGAAAPAAPAPGLGARPISVASLSSIAPGLGSSSTSAACSEKEHVAPASREDLAWTKRVTDAMAKGLARKRLVCMFGTPNGPNGDFVKVSPRHLGFASAMALTKAFDHPEEAIEVKFAKAAMPLVASVEKVLGPSKGAGRISVDAPYVRVIQLGGPKDVSIRALLTLAPDDLSRVATLRLDVADLRGWKAKPARCWDGVTVTVYPPSGDRFATGNWSFDAIDAATNASVGKFSCTVPDDILDVGGCTPAGEQPPRAEQRSMATAIDLHLPGQTPILELTATHEGGSTIQARVAPRYRTGPAANTPSGTCTSAIELVPLKKP